MTTELKSPPCRVCGQREPVLCWPCDPSERAVCPECCETATHPGDGETGHVWEYSQHERGDECRHCGILKRDTRYAWDD